MLHDTAITEALARQARDEAAVERQARALSRLAGPPEAALVDGDSPRERKPWWWSVAFAAGLVVLLLSGLSDFEHLRGWTRVVAGVLATAATVVSLLRRRLGKWAAR
ncbi:MAG TPA: hypothetical protein VFT50_05215 [Baekduia sp.]|nr:hypothetical protein [Baekduia sp.]